MNKFTDAFIKDLSIKDKKTLSQKVLKVVEEVGELAKVILPFDSAPGVLHRFTDREKILEEIVDVYLTNISILHSLNFSDTEFDEMLITKMNKWNMLQLKESEATYPLPYEIHITVDLQQLLESNFTIEYFKNDCNNIGVKPIILDLEINTSVIKDVMTSSKHFGDNRSVYDESMRIVNNLKRLGYNVVRNKIESVPWHPAAPTLNTGEPIINSCYFESHIGVSIMPDEKILLQNFIDEINNNHIFSGTCKLSQNFFKKSKDSKFVNMLTYRNNMTCRSEFEQDVHNIKCSLKEQGFDFEKVEIEFAIYDTNVKHDAKWLTT